MEGEGNDDSDDDGDDGGDDKSDGDDRDDVNDGDDDSDDDDYEGGDGGDGDDDANIESKVYDLEKSKACAESSKIACPRGKKPKWRAHNQKPKNPWG
ncbi:hypothetical protein CRG98_006037 [Punica granatum]|uniref:Uncharacterized protein n=1 Tax=Punica granatum TaxID=22663 RepID=A0A2I0KYP2_PUNGR|nr:hypothetical protein CRG98_006037 [Punica granatum]